jgi:DNA-binding transcriptional MerR regulator
MKNLFLLGDVARLVGVEPYRIVYLLSSGQLPEPPRFGGRRVFSHEHIEGS